MRDKVIVNIIEQLPEQSTLMLSNYSMIYDVERLKSLKVEFSINDFGDILVLLTEKSKKNLINFFEETRLYASEHMKAVYKGVTLIESYDLFDSGIMVRNDFKINLDFARENGFHVSNITDE